jgi:hypothetical protein
MRRIGCRSRVLGHSGVRTLHRVGRSLAHRCSRCEVGVRMRVCACARDRVRACQCVRARVRVCACVRVPLQMCDERHCGSKRTRCSSLRAACCARRRKAARSHGSCARELRSARWRSSRTGPHLHSHICAGTWPTSAPGPGPHLRRDLAHICTGTGCAGTCSAGRRRSCGTTRARRAAASRPSSASTTAS